MGSVEPVVAGIELHQGNGAFDLLPVHLGHFPAAGVDQGSINATVRKSRRAHEVGPQTMQRNWLVPCQAQLTTFFNGNGYVVRVKIDVVETDIAKRALDVEGRLFRPWIADNARSLTREEFDLLLEFGGLRELG